MFDDENVVSIGAWREVVKYCVENRCYPTVILFEKLSLADEVPERSLISESEVYDLQYLSQQSDRDYASDFD